MFGMDTSSPGIASITVTVTTTPDPRAMTRLVQAMMGPTSETPSPGRPRVSAPHTERPGWTMPPDQGMPPTSAVAVPRCVIYGRVSTAGQVEGTSLTGQLDACREVATRHGWEVVAECVDAGESGANADRPALAEVMDSVDSGDVDVLIVYRLDRLARSTLHLLTLVQQLEAAQVRLVSTSESIDTRTPTGRMTMTVLGSVAELERETIRTRTREGVARRVAQGGWVSSTPPFGFRAVPDTRAGMRGVVLQIDPAQATAIREMYRLLVAERVPLTAAAAALNAAGHRTATGQPWTRATLSTWARGPRPTTTAAGRWCWGATEVTVPAILSPDQVREWAAWQADTSVTQTSHGQYLLSGHLLTPCGRRYHGRTATGQAPVYSCRHHLSTKAGSPEHCACTNIAVSAADAAVWGEVVHILTDPGALAAVAAEVAGVGVGPGDTEGARAAEASRSVAELQERVAVEYQGARDAGFDAATARLMVRGVQAELQAAQAEMARLARARAAAQRQHVGADSLSHTLSRVEGRITELDLAGKRDVLRALEVRAQVTGYAPCSVCGGSGYLACPPGAARGFPPACGHCHQLRRLPVLQVSIMAPEALHAVEGIQLTA